MTTDRGYVVAQAAANIVGLSMAILGGKRRTQHLATMRQEWCWYMRKATDLSFPEIAKLINKDHSTIVYAVQKYEKMFQNGSRARLQRNLDLLHTLEEPSREEMAIFNFNPRPATEGMRVGELRQVLFQQRKAYAERLRQIDIKLSSIDQVLGEYEERP